MNIEFQILIIIFIHWIADFLLQSKEMATKKSKNIDWLAIHVYIYSLVWLLIGMVLFKPTSVLIFTGITFICHFITDYFTSRWTSKLYKQKKFYGFPAFFPVIGLDQVLHYIQLILTYKYIILQ